MSIYTALTQFQIRNMTAKGAYARRSGQRYLVLPDGHGIYIPRSRYFDPSPDSSMRDYPRRALGVHLPEYRGPRTSSTRKNVKQRKILAYYHSHPATYSSMRILESSLCSHLASQTPSILSE